MRSARSRLARFAGDVTGVAAIEMALVSGLLIMLMCNVAELGRYAYVVTQVSAATQAAAQAALVTCDPTKTPATIACPALDTAMTAAAHSTSLGAEVELDEDVREAWYCVNAQGALEKVAEVGKKPEDCADVDRPGEPPALYLQVRTSHEFEALFPGLTVVDSFRSTIERTSWMRMK